MILKDVTTEYETKKVFKYAKDGNTVVRPTKRMRRIAQNIYAGEPYTDGYDEYCEVYICFDGVERGLLACRPSTQRSIEEVVGWVAEARALTIEDIVEESKRLIERGSHIRLLNIAFVAQFDTQLARDMEAARADYIERYEKRKSEERAKRIAEEDAFVAEKNAEAERRIAEALSVLKNGGVLTNHTVAIYRSRYDLSEYSVVNYLCRKYGINLPLRTQGWVNDSLANLTITDEGKCNQLCYYKRKKTSKPSDVIYGYINSLCDAVRSEV